jgi:hypothetical protein
MFYPLVEYSLIFYLVMNFITIALSYQRGELTKMVLDVHEDLLPYRDNSDCLVS